MTSPQSTPADLDAREAFLIDLVRSAGAVARAGFARADRGIRMKGPQDFLTETDTAVEAHVRDRVAAAFPGDGVLGEEGGGGPAPDLWVVDPIDGTANFARGLPHYCVAIAFVSGGVTRLGAIYDPSRDELYRTREGRGASRNGQPIRVSATTDPGRAAVEFGCSPSVPRPQYVAGVAALLDRGFSVRRASSGALGLAYVADGRNDAYAEYLMHPWDCLAGLLMVAEAGGRIGAFGLAQAPVIAATPGIAEAVAEATGIPLSGDA